MNDIFIDVIKNNDRGYQELNWLKSFHSFSFGHYYNPKRMGFKNLRVINDDEISPHNGFGFHPHKDMEIITFMLEGELEHQDSLGNKRIIKKGDLQVMTAGTGIVHSEMNHGNIPTRLLQIWILPDQLSHVPSYREIHLPNFLNSDKNFELLLSNNHTTNPLQKINAKATLSHLSLQEEHPSFTLHPQNNTRNALYIHVYQGAIDVIIGGQKYSVSNGDGVCIVDGSHSSEINFQQTSKECGKALIFELD